MAVKINKTVLRTQIITEILKENRYGVTIAELHEIITSYPTAHFTEGFDHTDRTTRRTVEQLQQTGEELGFYIDIDANGRVFLEEKKYLTTLQKVLPAASQTTKISHEQTLAIELALSQLIEGGSPALATIVATILDENTSFSASSALRTKEAQKQAFDFDELAASFDMNQPVAYSTNNGKDVSEGYITDISIQKGRAQVTFIDSAQVSHTYPLSSITQVEQIMHLTNLTDEIIPFPEPQPNQAA